MINQIDSWWWYKLNGVLRESIARGHLRHCFESIIVTEYPKSGGTWLSLLLSETTGYPYPRNRLPVLKKSIMHGCWLQPNPNHKTIALFRDGRDIMVSYYFHLVFPKTGTSSAYRNMIRNRIGVTDPKNVKKYMPSFIEWAFTEGYPGWTWSDYTDRWLTDPTAIFTTYEALINDTTAEVSRLLTCLGIEYDETAVPTAVDKFSFAAQSGRKPGNADNTAFIRKGISGDWINCFTLDSANLFLELAGDQLIAAGYEADNSWIEKVK